MTSNEVVLTRALQVAEALWNGTVGDDVEGCAFNARNSLKDLLSAIADSSPAAKLAAAKVDGFLCRAWGESDEPSIELVADWEGVRRFMIREWLGDADEVALTMLETDFAEHEEDQRGGSYDIEFEIGGVSVERISLTVATPIPADSDRSGAPISEDRIDAAAAFWTDDECFRQGVYWAETKHGIRGEGE